jgi:arsenical pump membrane protein
LEASLLSPEIVAPSVAVVAVAGVIARPFDWPEYLWALAGALVLVIVGVLSPADAVAAAAKGDDVYLFLTGMMLLSELARQQGVFDYLAVIATRRAGGSPPRLFLIIYGVGALVTVFLSNDATAVVLTPAVYAVTRAAKVNPLPYLYVCAFIANAASFVLPISNPANLVIYGDHMPGLLVWLAHLGLPAIVAVATTFFVHRWVQRRDLGVGDGAPGPVVLSGGGRIALAGIGATALVLLLASALRWPLGVATCASGVLVALLVLLRERRGPLPLIRHVSWGVLPLVAGLFILVDGLNRTGLLRRIADLLHAAGTAAPDLTAGLAGLVAGFGSNLINNLPMGLIAATVAHEAVAPAKTLEALLIGVDLGPNLSVTGSLATILWLIALRREKIAVSARQFLKLGALVMPPALLLALIALLLEPR